MKTVDPQPPSFVFRGLSRVCAVAAVAAVVAMAAVASSGCATTLDPKARARAKISYDIGVASLNGGDTRGALRELLTAVRLDPELAEAHHALGLVFHALGRLNDSMTHYETAVTLRPKFSEAYNNMGVLLIDLGRYDDAIAAFELALADILYRTPSLAEGNMGWAHYRKGDTESALQHLRNAVATNAKFCRGYEWLARIGLDVDDADLTVQSGRRFQKHCADDAEVVRQTTPEYLRQMRYYLGVGLLKKGQREAARTEFASCATTTDEGDASFGSRCAASLKALPGDDRAMPGP